MEPKSAKLVELAQQYAMLRSEPYRYAAELSATARELDELLLDLETERLAAGQHSDMIEMAHSFLSL